MPHNNYALDELQDIKSISSRQFGFSERVFPFHADNTEKPTKSPTGMFMFMRRTNFIYLVVCLSPLGVVAVFVNLQPISSHDKDVVIVVFVRR